MRALVVFESMFGNTERIAKAVAAGIADRMQVDVVEVGSAPEQLPSDVALLVVGGPTHAFGMSRPATREDATRQAHGHVVSEKLGIREWLEALDSSKGVPASAFDTRIKSRWAPGSAARGAQKRLTRLGYSSAASAQTFYVAGTPGPLLEGEVARAQQWGERLVPDEAS
jgi:Flavodoxin